MSEYFIRYPDSEEAKGPYNLEQLQSLSEAKRVKPETTYSYGRLLSATARF